MEIGLVLVGYMDRSLAEALDVTLAHGITVVEPCGGGHFPDTHYSPEGLARDPQALKAFAREFNLRGMRIAAFACHGNPLHPDSSRRTKSRQSFEATCQIAGELGVTKVDVLSGVDLRMVNDLGPGMVGYATVKDVEFRADEIARNGLLPGCNYADWDKRSWTYRALGYGHPEEFWRRFVSALRLAGYDEDLAIEIEDPYLTRDDAVRASLEMIRRVMPRDPQPTGNWFDAYEWKAADND